MAGNLAFKAAKPRASAAPDVITVAPAKTPPLSDLLSTREEEIAQLAADGLSNKEIGQRLGISHWTVSTHLRRTFIKLEVTKRIELCRLITALS